MQKNNYFQEGYSSPLTLERHLDALAQRAPSVKSVQSIWNLLKKDLEEALLNLRGVFGNFSLHDASHSRKIIHIIERILGKKELAV